MKKLLDAKIRSRLRKLLAANNILAFMKKEDPESKTKRSKSGVKSNGRITPKPFPCISPDQRNSTIAGFWTSYAPVTPLCLPHSSLCTGMCSVLSTYCLTTVCWVYREKTAVSSFTGPKTESNYTQGTVPGELL